MVSTSIAQFNREDLEFKLYFHEDSEILRNYHEIYQSTTDGRQLPEEESKIFPTTDQTVLSDWVKMSFYAAVGNSESFIEIVNQLDLSTLSAEVIIQIIDYSLDMGLVIMARKISQQGSSLHSENDELQKYNRILSPPKVIRKDLPPYPQAELNVRWLKENWSAYRGQWVAIKEGVLLASAPNARELISRFDYKKNSKVLITRV